MTRSRYTLRGSNAFTLMEVVIVVAILLLVAALLLPSFAEARRQSARLACAVNLRAFGDAMTAYRTHYHRYPQVGDRNPYGMLASNWKPWDPRPARPVLYNIGDLAEALVMARHIKPDQMYCPSSLRYDKLAPAPFRDPSGRYYPRWRTGEISYIYLAGIKSTFPDADGQPTYEPSLESPDRTVNRVNHTRAVLAGDRTIELQPGKRNVAGSNHGREGGWFYFTSGDTQWWSWNRLTFHPSPVYKWCWPRLSRSPNS